MNRTGNESKQRRRGHNEGTGYQRNDGRWEWRVTLPDGSRRSFYGPTQRQAREKASRALQDLADGLDLTAERMTVGTYIERWLADTAAQRVRPSTQESYRSHIERHLIPTLGHHRIRALSPAHVNKMLAALVASGMSPTTANRIRATLRTALASALKAGYVTKNVAALADARTERKARIEPLTLAQIHALLDATAGTRQGALYHVAIATGLRQGELFALRWEDIDLDAGILSGRHGLTRRPRRTLPDTAESWALSDPKTDGSRRALRLTAGAVDALRTQRRTVAELEMAAAQRWQEHGFVFPSTVGTPQNASNVTHEFQAALDRLGLPRQRFHDLRHATATLLLAEGMDLFTVKEILGHSQISLTANTYGHLTRKLADVAALRLGDALSRRASDASIDAKSDDKTAGIDDKTHDRPVSTRLHLVAKTG